MTKGFHDSSSRKTTTSDGLVQSGGSTGKSITNSSNLLIFSDSPIGTLVPVDLSTIDTQSGNNFMNASDFGNSDGLGIGNKNQTQYIIRYLSEISTKPPNWVGYVVVISTTVVFISLIAAVIFNFVVKHYKDQRKGKVTLRHESINLQFD